ncbi:MAG: RNB domain-containing ribonuclease, partial [Rhodocyclaceae bacterium]|nr:RNB domain-containing ribonuclease [Rhodocyclaceae bacterium]
RPELPQAALAAQERKRRAAEPVDRRRAELVAGALPAEFPAALPALLYKPDRGKMETKALEAACAETGLSAPRLLQQCGALADTHHYHLGRFLFEFFPKGTDFPPHAPATSPDDLPLASIQAFSIDDAHTTEIDDAFSVVFQPDGALRVGIHIAAPALGMTPESELGRIARERLSTVYMPGRKITMLPEAVVEGFTLAEGRTVPALSLYLDVAADLRILSHETRIERVAIAANLRHHDIEPVFNDETLAAGLPDFPFRDELKRLWELATVLEAGRGATNQTNRKDYNYEVDWTRPTASGVGHIRIVERQRGSPLDTLVAELMIVANATWGALLRDAGIPALYRVQTAGKTRMSTVAAPHEGLGVDCYAWSSSPLRRYTDLLNQWQLVAHLRGEAPPFPPKSADLLAALRDFELTYAAYAEFQRGMERYWCLRWLVQEGIAETIAHVLREELVRLDDIPLVVKIHSLPVTERGARVKLAVDDIDLLEAEIRARYVELLGKDSPDEALEGEEGGE